MAASQSIHHTNLKAEKNCKYVDLFKRYDISNLKLNFLPIFAEGWRSFRLIYSNHLKKLVFETTLTVLNIGA